MFISQDSLLLIQEGKERKRKRGKVIFGKQHNNNNKYHVHTKAIKRKDPEEGELESKRIKKWGKREGWDGGGIGGGGRRGKKLLLMGTPIPDCKDWVMTIDPLGMKC